MDYVKPIKKGAELIKALKEYIVVLGFIASIFVGVVGLVVTSRVEPFLQGLDKLNVRVSAVESAIDDHSVSNQKEESNLVNAINDLRNTIVGTDRDSINTRLSRIEGKLSK